MAACSGQPTETTKTATSKPAPTAEEASIVNSSYIMGIARDTQELETLGAKTGWPEFFQGRYLQALDAFELRAHEPDAQFGAARSALALAQGFVRTMKIQTELTPLVVQAQGSRPGAKVMTAWHQYVKARGGVSDSRTKPADGIAHELFQLMAVEGDQFDIQAVGLLDKQDSDQLSVLKRRLKLRNRLKEQNKKGLKRRMRRLDYRIADITVNSDGQEFQLWDPGVSDIPSQYYAHRALGFLTLKGLCPATIRARALFLLGRLDEVVKTLDAGLKIAASKPAFSCLFSRMLWGKASWYTSRNHCELRRCS